MENGVPHGDGLRRTHAGRWKTLRLAPFPDRSGWKTGKMSKNPHALGSGRWCCYNREGFESGSVPGVSRPDGTCLVTTRLTTSQNTRWSSAAGVLPPFSRPSSSHQWIWVDCGADVPLRSVWVDFQNSAAVDYTVRLLTEAQAKALGLKKNGKAGGGPEKWKTIATGKGCRAV